MWYSPSMDRPLLPHQVSYRPNDVLKELYQFFLKCDGFSDAVAVVYTFCLMLLVAACIVNWAYDLNGLATPFLFQSQPPSSELEFLIRIGRS